MSDQECIGTVGPGRRGQSLAACALCSWTWTGTWAEAEKHLRGHAALHHPPVVKIYRTVGGTS